MPVTKVSASLEDEVVEEMRRRVGPRGISAFLNAAAREKLQRERILALLDAMDDEHGPVDRAARARATRKLKRVLE